ncbi:MAG: hypothetical protein JWO99_750 [Candidatus Saccharibacteria bacterium]|nr:hypothetical protein [Candidatus Saccharibacteria bacterium]
MQSFLHGALHHDSGYFHVWISSTRNGLFFASDEDKAFFISLIQDALSPRKKLDEINIKPSGYSSEIDLLAFSLTETGVHLLVHTARKVAIEEFGQILLLSYEEYLYAQHTVSILPFDSIFVFDKLLGRHEALNVSREIHLLHEDWRGDRYSSIGFYLDDRRGDWMRPYRLTSLFDNKPRNYLRFIRSQATESDRVFEYIET